MIVNGPMSTKFTYIKRKYDITLNDPVIDTAYYI